MISECPILENPANGAVDAGTDATSAVGTEATYTCNTGYTLGGDPYTVTCQTDGSWSADPPTCTPVGELYVHVYFKAWIRLRYDHIWISLRYGHSFEFMVLVK